MAEICPQWSILILTMPLRKALLDRLLKVLEPQISHNGHSGHNGHNVELIVRESDANFPVGENRELMRREARGKYISFIDDDDLVPPHFVSRILPLLGGTDQNLSPQRRGGRGGLKSDLAQDSSAHSAYSAVQDSVDYIGFNLEWRHNGEFGCIERRSLQFNHPQHGGVWNDREGRYRDLSHVNPMRRELALRVAMSGWPGEDNRWADALRDLRIVKTEHYLDETLYYYLTRSRKPELTGCVATVGSESYPWSGTMSATKKIKVKMLVSVAGNADERYDLPSHGYGAGQIIELHPELAASWIASGRAAAFVEKATEPESRQFSRAETADTFKAPAQDKKPEAAAAENAANAQHAAASRKGGRDAAKETKGSDGE